jgi:hypothetical protein
MHNFRRPVDVAMRRLYSSTVFMWKDANPSMAVQPAMKTRRPGTGRVEMPIEFPESARGAE